ncbi:hypothetical protein ACNOYE_03945 [Nannocystaceae bacterium ST9]
MAKHSTHAGIVVWLSLAGCETPLGEPVESSEQAGLPRSTAWGTFQMTRPDRAPHEVLRRAHAIGKIVLGDSQLPDPAVLDGADIRDWADVALAEPHRQAVVRFELGGRDILATYRPTGDRLTIAAMDTRVRPEHPQGEMDLGIGEARALVVAQSCIDGLEAAGVIGPDEFLQVPSETTSTPFAFRDEAWVERYNFVFNPDLDGLPLRSAEVIISVNAWSAVCQRITVGGQVRLSRIGDAPIVLRDAQAATTTAKSKILATTTHATEVTLTGDFGYYLPFEQDSAPVSPQFLVYYATHGPAGQATATSRKRFVGLSLDGHDGLTDLLGPTWQ